MANAIFGAVSKLHLDDDVEDDKISEVYNIEAVLVAI